MTAEVFPPPDLATVSARFGAALRDAGVPVGPDRVERFARAVTLARPATVRALRWCARATFASDPEQVAVVDRVVAAVFAGLVDPAENRGGADPGGDPWQRAAAPRTAAPRTSAAPPSGRAGDSTGRAAPPDGADSTAAGVPSVASDLERLAGRDFAELSPDELALLADLMRRRVLVTPLRLSRRSRPAAGGRRVDLRATLRRARRTGGDPARIARRVRRPKRRRLVVLCDISGSMAPYARAVLQLLCCAATDARVEVFTFATRLTRITAVMGGAATPAAVLDRAGRAAPDWSGGTRIGAAVREFNDRFGRRGMARGAVVLMVSDGWDTGDPAVLGRQMARLALVAHRVVWANPRTQDPRYRPLVGGMAAAWPYCDAVVSAHRLDALADLTAALAHP